MFVLPGFCNKAKIFARRKKTYFKKGFDRYNIHLSILSLFQIVQCTQKHWDSILYAMCWVSAVKKFTLFLKVGLDGETGFWSLNWVSTVNLGFNRWWKENLLRRQAPVILTSPNSEVYPLLHQNFHHFQITEYSTDMVDVSLCIVALWFCLKISALNVENRIYLYKCSI